MALLRQGQQNQFLTKTELLVGRSDASAWQLRFAYVSAQHALLRWSDQHWLLKDLGSRNGTFVNGARIAPGVFHRVDRGASLAFGDAEQAWELVDAGPPHCTVVPLDDGAPMVIEGELLAIPEPCDSFSTIFRDCNGQWMLEEPGQPTRPIANGARFSVLGRTFRFCCPDGDGTTMPLLAQAPQLSSLRFSVSLDEEHVTLCVVYGDRVVELGSRAHNYLLLTLARARLLDVENGLSPAESGWVYQDELAEGLRMSVSQLNVDVFRIRQHFGRSGASELVNAIERRPRTKQIRIGTSQLSIEKG